MSDTFGQLLRRVLQSICDSTVMLKRIFIVADSLGAPRFGDGRKDTSAKSSIRMMHEFLVEVDRYPSDHADSQFNNFLCL